MKKSLVALAVLAASGASFAQSVTLYGTADIWFGATSATGAETQTVLNSGGIGGSKWGMKGSEDLGGGLKANFKLEQGFSVDTGAGKNGFNREAWVGFSGGFGEVRLGNAYTAYDDVSGAANASFDSNVAPQVNVWASTDYTSNPGNQIKYSTPDMGGFSGAVSYALGENKTAALSAGSVVSLSAQYAAGPLFVGLGYQEDKAQNGSLATMDPVTGVITAGAAATALTSTKFTRLNATYDFGAAKLLAGYGRVAKAGDATTTEWELGADFPVSAALTLSGGFARSSDNTAAGDETRKGYGFAASYTLSKRTSVYGAFRSATATNAGVDSTDRTTAVGVRHNF